jgi:hypothetical protein
MVGLDTYLRANWHISASQVTKGLSFNPQALALLSGSCQH